MNGHHRNTSLRFIQARRIEFHTLEPAGPSNPWRLAGRARGSRATQVRAAYCQFPAYDLSRAVTVATAVSPWMMVDAKMVKATTAHSCPSSMNSTWVEA